MVRKATEKDVKATATLAHSLWKNQTLKNLQTKFVDIVSKDDCAIFIKIVGDEIVGFAQCGLRRDYVEGTNTSPVGYFEGVFMSPTFRGKGYAKELLSACEKWAKDLGCTEFASDCEFCNTQSQAFHLHSGFKEANKIVCFTKKIK